MYCVVGSVFRESTVDKILGHTDLIRRTVIGMLDAYNTASENKENKGMFESENFSLLVCIRLKKQITKLV